MDFNFTEEQDMVRDGLTRLVREQYDWDTRRGVIESEAGWRPEIWQQLAELGILGMPFSEEIKLEAILRGHRFGEEHIPYGVRTGEVKLQKWRDGWENLLFLVRKRFGLV